MSKLKVAIIGSGNIGTDLMVKIARNAKHLELVAMVGVDPASEGLARARDLGCFTTHEGLEGLRRTDLYKLIDVFFDATSAKAHLKHAEVLGDDGKRIIDLTPAAISPYVVPPVNLDAHLGGGKINMVTCGGQATIPMVAAVARVGRVHYAEIIASISSRSAGPGTRANIDEFTETTSRAIESVGGAERGKAIIVLNPAEPPMIMRDTVYCLTEATDREAIAASVKEMVDTVAGYVPGYRLKQDVQFETIPHNAPVNVPGLGPRAGLKVAIFLEVEGAGHFLPEYAGNLDIMTSAAMAAAERMAKAELQEAV